MYGSSFGRSPSCVVYPQASGHFDIADDRASTLTFKVDDFDLVPRVGDLVDADKIGVCEVKFPPSPIDVQTCK